MYPIEESEYRVVALDHEGYDLQVVICQTLEEAKRMARALIMAEDLDGEVYKTEVTKGTNPQCLYDYFLR
jgi:hypothetical protein